ncbi:MAG TPA: leucyl/phenylalanyl-tRNA--protein transferase [Flavisolibacter sp.]|jgi:leucyl/phenylalanyl-tRNA--protein transferase|nr:leucyl/phenylalanyl-tRNA--protein transferase [Flavisolibacter sp.]
MPIVCFSEAQFRFPPLHQADEEGLLVIGGTVTPERVLQAYPNGIFPWYSDDIPLWWSPDPRFVLFPAELHISRSMKKELNNEKFDFRTNTAFEEVITACATVPRNGQDGTWITTEMKEVYIELHQRGFAHSAETWLEDKMVGGMYGIRLGKVFFGESMFSKVTNASKFAFIRYVQQLKGEGVALVDCQVYTPHVESLGARLIPRQNFIELLRQHC